MIQLRVGLVTRRLRIEAVLCRNRPPSRVSHPIPRRQEPAHGENSLDDTRNQENRTTTDCLRREYLITGMHPSPLKSPSTFERTYVRMHAAYEDVPRRQRGLRANVRAYIHHKRGCNHRSAPTPPESRKHLGGSKPPARETSSKPPRFPQYYVRTFVRPSVAYARKSVRTYVRSCFSKDFLGYPTFCWDLQFNNNPD